MINKFSNIEVFACCYSISGHHVSNISLTSIDGLWFKAMKSLLLSWQEFKSVQGLLALNTDLFPSLKGNVLL